MMTTEQIVRCNRCGERMTESENGDWGHLAGGWVAGLGGSTYDLCESCMRGFEDFMAEREAAKASSEREEPLPSPEYCVRSSSYPVEFASRVERHMLDGWRLQGGVQVSYNTETKSWHYFQAMVR